MGLLGTVHGTGSGMCGCERMQPSDVGESGEPYQMGQADVARAGCWAIGWWRMRRSGAECGEEPTTNKRADNDEEADKRGCGRTKVLEREGRKKVRMRKAGGNLRGMDEDWELLLASHKDTAAAEPYAGNKEDNTDAIKHDYFNLGSDAKYARRALLSKGDSKEEEELLADSGNLGSVELDPDDLIFSSRDHEALWSDWE